MDSGIMSKEEITTFAKINFTNLLHKVRNHESGISKQPGFLHLRKMRGYCSSPQTKDTNLIKQSNYYPIPVLKLWHPTKELTLQAIQKACEKERKSRLEKYYKTGFPHNYSFNKFLDEFYSLVREAEQLEMRNEKKSKSRNEWNFTSVLEEIQRRGSTNWVSKKMEAGLQETLANIWSNVNNLKGSEEITYQAKIHQTKTETYKDIIWAVRRLKDFSAEEALATTNYYSDLKDQIVQDIRRKALNITNLEQINIEKKSRLEDDLRNIEDPMILKVVDQKNVMHTELLKLYDSVLKKQETKSIKIMEKQAQLKEGTIEEITLNYLKNQSLKERSIEVEAIPEILQNKNRQFWQKAQKEVLILAKIRLENNNYKNK